MENLPGFAEFCWTAQIEGARKLNKGMAPQVGLETLRLTGLDALANSTTLRRSVLFIVSALQPEHESVTLT
jgi:hypothetical protein